MVEGRSVTKRPLTPGERAKIERYLEAQRARPQARALPSASMAVNRVMRPLAAQGQKRGSSALALARVWPEIMGPRWSKISAPVRFRGSKTGRTLVISAPGPAASLILAASGQILERLATHLGADQVNRIEVVQAPARPAETPPRRKRGLTPSEETQLQEGLTQVRNERLKTALERLGREVIRNQT
ncbi:hypothetical protein GCM10007854_02860 [Algimonas porphyrae]|uniref:DUF721 domain-containing protein n=1 Tax=Algimonas porphyrae TaxID=1128113 RepID=A0ABQ5UVN0_9PROT|nr:hypothetical protein GCM10007854_02860 [Algimonas porphyrae]